MNADNWGRVVEAEQAYTSLLSQLRLQKTPSPVEAEFFRRLSASITTRLTQMRAPVSPKMALTSGDLRVCLEAWKTGNLAAFPLDPVKYSAGLGGFAIRVEAWGLKDAETYLDPITVVSLVDRLGNISDSQTTAISHHPRRAAAVVFEETLKFPGLIREGISVFFEFQHWKPKKRKLSTRCWTFIDLADLAKFGAQPVNLEIYHKPTDLTKKKLKLHSVKDLFLQCSLSSCNLLCSFFYALT